MKREIVQARSARTEMEYQAILAGRFRNDDPTVEQKGVYFNAEDSAAQRSIILERVEREVDQLTPEMIRIEAEALRIDDRESIVQRLTNNIDLSQRLIRISDLTTKYGSPGIFEVEDRVGGTIIFRQEPRYEFPSFLRKSY